jgi:large subunit ribosomal protein L30
MPAKLKVTQVKSTISHIARNRATVRALGLHGIGSTSVVSDNPATRGMVRQVRFLVTVEEIASADLAPQASSSRGGDERAGTDSPRPRPTPPRAIGSRTQAGGGADEDMGRISGDGEKA